MSPLSFLEGRWACEINSAIVLEEQVLDQASLNYESWLARMNEFSSLTLALMVIDSTAPVMKSINEILVGSVIGCIILNVLSSYLKNWFDSWLSKYSSIAKARSEARAKKEGQAVKILSGDLLLIVYYRNALHFNTLVCLLSLTVSVIFAGFGLTTLNSWQGYFFLAMQISFAALGLFKFRGLLSQARITSRARKEYMARKLPRDSSTLLDHQP